MFLYLSCNTITLSLSTYTPPLREPRLKEVGDYCDSLSNWLPKHRTIIIVLLKYNNPPFLVADEIVFLDELLKNKQASSALSEEIVLSYSLVQKHKTH